MVTSTTHRELSLPASLLLASLGTDYRLKLWVWGGWARGADRSPSPDLRVPAPPTVTPCFFRGFPSGESAESARGSLASRRGRCACASG